MLRCKSSLKWHGSCACMQFWEVSPQSHMHVLLCYRRDTTKVGSSSISPNEIFHSLLSLPTNFLQLSDFTIIHDLIDLDQLTVRPPLFDENCIAFAAPSSPGVTSWRTPLTKNTSKFRLISSGVDTHKNSRTGTS